jgi:hypothetical protein
MLRSFILFAGLVLALGLAGCSQQAKEPAEEVVLERAPATEPDRAYGDYPSESEPDYSYGDPPPRNGGEYSAPSQPDDSYYYSPEIGEQPSAARPPDAAYGDDPFRNGGEVYAEAPQPDVSYGDDPGIISGPAIEEQIPKFPWPPPRASQFTEIPSIFFEKSEAQEQVLSDIDQELSKALDLNEYTDKSYFAVPNGFTLVTRLEQIHSDGRSKEPPDRWAEDISTRTEFALLSYITALFTSEKGYYRIIAFIVTDKPFTNTGAEVTRDEAELWLFEGFNRLPNSIGNHKYTDSYKTWAYVYEFEQPGTGQEVRLNVPGHLPITAKDHMIKAKLWEALKN